MSQALPMWGNRKRPGLVWAIVIFMLVGIIGGAVSYAFLCSGMLNVPVPVRNYQASFGVLDNALFVTTWTCNLVAAVLLFLGRRAALHFLLGGFGLKLVDVGLMASSSPPSEVLGTRGIVRVCVGFAINLLVLVYVYRLSRRGAQEAAVPRAS